jgi:hypothetical protein
MNDVESMNQILLSIFIIGVFLFILTCAMLTRICTIAMSLKYLTNQIDVLIKQLADWRNNR